MPEPHFLEDGQGAIRVTKGFEMKSGRSKGEV